MTTPPLPKEDAEPTCDKCNVPLTTGLMAAICPYRERCEFWPDDIESQKWLDSLNIRYNPGATP
jgi:hypothetical protein